MLKSVDFLYYFYKVILVKLNKSNSYYYGE